MAGDHFPRNTRACDIAQYRAFCAAHPEIPVFFQDWYLDAVCENGYWDAVLLKGQSGEVEAVWPFFVKKKMGVPLYHDAAFCKIYGSVGCGWWN